MYKSNNKFDILYLNKKLHLKILSQRLMHQCQKIKTECIYSIKNRIKNIKNGIGIKVGNERI